MSVTTDTAARAPHAGISFPEFVALVASMMAINALAIDAMLPALPEIGDALGLTDENQRQTVITAYLLGFGIAQLAYGSLSDRFGRKPVVIAGLVVFGCFALLSVVAQSFTLMLVARFLQGVGSAATRVIAVSIVRDCYGGRRMASVMSLTMIIFITVPVVAPSIGQAIVLLGPWRAIFGFLALAGFAIAAWTAWRLPETLPRERRIPLSPRAVLGSFATVLTSRATVGYTLATAVVMGGLFGFINSAQQIFVDIFDVGTAFPLFFALVAVFTAASSYLNSRIVERLGMRKVGHTALLAYAAIAVVHAAAALAGYESLVAFVAFQGALMFAFGLMMSNFNAMAIDPVGHVAGAASSVMGFISTIGGAVVGYFIGQAYDGTTVPFAVAFAALGVASVVIVFVTEGGRLFHAKHAAAE